MKDILSAFLAKIKKNYILASFFLGALSFFMYLSYSQMFNGKYSVVNGDSLEIYIPTILQFIDDILSGNSISYSWTNCLGMDTFGYNLCSSFSLFNILFLLKYFFKINTVVCLILSLKAGLAALFFELYFETVHSKKNLFTLLMSVAYSCCSFQTYYNTTNFIWMDSFYLLPLLFTLIYLYHTKGSWKLLLLTLSYLYLSCFYLAYIVGIFCFIYYLAFLIIYDSKNKIKKILPFISIAIAAGLLVACILLPGIISISSNVINDSSFLNTEISNPAGVYLQLFWGQYQNSLYSSHPYIYCSILSLLCAPLYFISTKTDKKSKLLYGICLLILSISFCFKPFNYFWHGLNVPDGWNYRYSFMFSFLLCIIACLVLCNISKEDIKPAAIVSLIDILIYTLLVIFNNEDTNKASLLLTVSVNIILLLLYLSILYFLCKTTIKEDIRKAIYAGVIFLIAVELISNGWTESYFNENMMVSSTVLEQWEDNCTKIQKYTNDDSSFYRIDIIGDHAFNSDTYIGQNGLSDFASVENITLKNTLHKLGVATSDRVNKNDGYTDFLKMILSVKYNIKSEIFSPLRLDEQSPEISVSDYYLPLGFIVDKDLEKFSFENNPFVNINTLASDMCGEEVILYENIPPEEMSLHFQDVDSYAADSVITLKKRSDNSSVSFSVSDTTNDNYYGYILTDSSYIPDNSPTVSIGQDNNSFSYNIPIDEAQIFPLKKTEDNNVFEIQFNEDSDSSCTLSNYYIAKYNADELKKIHSKLNQNPLLIDHLKDGYILGHINSTEDNQLLFTSIPYDSNWTLYINNNPAQVIPLVDNTFVGVQLEKGNNIIELRYHNSYFVIGCIISLLTFAILSIVTIYEYRTNKTNKKITNA